MKKSVNNSSYTEIKGDLIKLTLQGEFDVIAHGCNCFCTMGAGIAPLMTKNFGSDKARLEKPKTSGDINKLGQIDFVVYKNPISKKKTIVVNCYTQYSTASFTNEIAVDYAALRLCMKKLNHVYKNKHIGLPKIGCGLAGGNWTIVKNIIISELKDCQVTVVCL